MTISRAQMNRQLYQMGGIGTLPMDFGQPLQVSQPMMNPSFAPMQPMMNNPMSNYGQTPLTMMGGGITRLGYQEGGMDQMMMEPQMQEQMMQPPINPSAMDAKQALELIIQMLIERGIPPEEAREIAIQMVQAVAEGGMEQMSDKRIEARFGGRIGYTYGGIGNLINREQYGFGSKIFKGAKKIVSGAIDAVTDVAKSDVGKIALTVAAIYAGGGGFSPEGFSFFGAPGFGAEPATAGLFGSGGEFGLGSSYLGSGLTRGINQILPASFGSIGNIASSLIPSTRDLVTGGLGYLVGRSSGPPKREDFDSDEEFEAAVARYKAEFKTAMNNPKPQFAKGLFPNNPFYPQQAANGGRIGYALGAEVPTRQNQAGITELDYRKQGGFVPPIGIKEKADDIPAMLSNNEFVFTADAVRNAGGGDVNRGAKRMYGLMKNLEAGGIV